jgi:hypothetical protein
MGTFDLVGSNAFDRSRVRLSALFWTDGALRIIVTTQLGTGSSFFLYNPFSTPELRDRKKEPHFTPKRTLDTASSTLNITYAGSNTSHALLSTGIEDGAVDPRHAVEGQAWEQAFFHQDNRHAFFVTTQERSVRVSHWKGSGIAGAAAKPSLDIPPLVFRPDKLEKPPIPLTKVPGFGVIDPTPSDYLVTEDVYLKNALGTRGTVRYGESDIGPSGSRFGLRVR